MSSIRPGWVGFQPTQAGMIRPGVGDRMLTRAGHGERVIVASNLSVHLREEISVPDTTASPAVTGIHHFSPTVSDVEASAQWYERVFGLARVPVPFPHHDAEEGGYAVVLMDPRSGMVIGLHHHDANPGQLFQESRTGLDHVAFGVTDLADLDAWASWLDELGIKHSGVIHTDNPMPYSVVVFRDPDDIQLELFYMAS
jgi:glyoxylase I family protein